MGDIPMGIFGENPWEIDGKELFGTFLEMGKDHGHSIENH